MRERRCIVTGEVRPENRLVRFVVGPDGDAVPDLEAKLPGRGMWVTAEAAVLGRAASRNAFAKAAKAPVKVAPDLAVRVEKLLTGRIRSDLGLAQRAGLLVSGFDNVVRALGGKEPPPVLVEAAEGAMEGRGELAAAARARGLRVETIDWLSRAELSLALGGGNVIHAAVGPGPLAERLIFDSARLKGLLPAMEGMAGSSPASDERNA